MPGKKRPAPAASAGDDVLAPGEALPSTASSSSSGEGTYVWTDGSLRASVAGRLGADKCSVAQPPSRKRWAANLPAVGDLVTCRVSRINPRQAALEILIVGNAALREPCSGLLRREDIGGREPVVYLSFRPGDIVRARVLSLGDSRSYYLSTAADPTLGVVLCRSSEGAVMRAVSHCEVECPVSGVRERRKVAKPADMPVTAAAATVP